MGFLPICPVPKKKRRHHPTINTSQTTGLLQCQSAFDAPYLRVAFEANGRPGNGGKMGAINLKMREGFL